MVKEDKFIFNFITSPFRFYSGEDLGGANAIHQL